jgi:predicted nucleic acid-binding protein
MTLIDTSVWIDHFRSADGALMALLESGDVCSHPMVIGELACGHLPQRSRTLVLLQQLPAASDASPAEALDFIARQRLDGRGIGHVDVHLLAATLITPGTTLWTRDRRLAAIARELRIAHAA